MSGAHVVVVGAGGNIGSHLVPHLGRMTWVGRVTLIDGGRYEPSNLSGQDVTRRDLSRSKVAVQAERLRLINPALRVSTHFCRVEELPLGRLRADIILACLDSRAARQYVNESAWRLGVAWIDAAVEGGQLLARVNVYWPEAGAPCLECAWDDHDYAALEQEYPCGVDSQAAATRAPSSLGAIAAALQAIECQKLLTESPVPAVTGRQVLLDLAYDKQYVTSLRRQPSCGLRDHQPWAIQPLRLGPRDLTVATALALAGSEGLGFGIAGRRLASHRMCLACSYERRGLQFVCALASNTQRCPRCEGQLVSPGSHMTEELASDIARSRLGRRTLASLGVRRSDVVIVRTAHGESHFEIGCDRE